MKFSIMPSRAVSDPRLQPNVVRTLSALCCYTSANGICYPNQSTLGDLIGVSRALVSRNIGILRQYGYVIDLEPLGKKQIDMHLGIIDEYKYKKINWERK